MSATLTLSAAADLFVAGEPFALEHGAALPSLELAYEFIGAGAGARFDGDAADGAPVVIVQGGISAHPHAASSPRDPTPGWWSAQVGEGRALDPRRLRLLSLEFLGKRHDAVVTSGDQARATALLLDRLGIERVHAFVGASYGGMVALRFAELFPGRVERVVAISAADRSRVFATAWRALQRELLAAGRDGASATDERTAVSLARAFALLSYRSPAGLEERFAGAARPDAEGVLRFPVESWLLEKGREFATRFDAGGYLRLSRAIDLHRADVSRIRAHTTLVGADPDLLVPFDQLEELSRRFTPAATLVRIPSRYGHDAFLKETAAIGAALATALGAACEGALR